MNESDDETLPAADGERAAVDVDGRYELKSTIGRGGMGEVRLARDTRIDRDVAVKLLRSTVADKDMIARFLREARVQGALEHPAIPPVHDLGKDSDGHPYFVMKKLAGTTLQAVLEERATLGLDAKWSRRALLARFVDVCLAIEFAHTRGVVHRDLKPANIMLGEFGETYVLDWGLARIDSDELSSIAPLSGEHEVGQTIAGALLGTPGYMAPEQARGEPIDGRADVYALGCILYEILVGTPALPRGLAAIDLTLTSEEHRPSARVDVPLELDGLCARATAQDRTKRPSARQLGDGIQAYLDGDRDLEARKTLAVERAERAKARLEDPGDAARADAMREASRALALDPKNHLAQELVARLVLEPPAAPPSAAIEQADLERGRSRQRLFRRASTTYASVVLFMAVFFLFPVHHAWPIVAAMALSTVQSVMFALLSRVVLPMRSSWYLVALLINTAGLCCAAFILGPMLILPIFLVSTLAGFLLAPTSYSAAAITIAHTIPFLGPVALELAGLMPRTFTIEDGSLILTPWAVGLTPVSAMLVLFIGVLSQIASTAIVVAEERHGQIASLDRVHVQSWHLKQLVPDARQRAATDEDVLRSRSSSEQITQRRDRKDRDRRSDRKR